MKLQIINEEHDGGVAGPFDMVNWQFVNGRGNTLAKGVPTLSKSKCKKQLIGLIRAIQRDDFTVYDYTDERPAAKPRRIMLTKRKRKKTVSRRVSR